jgi:DNA-binding NtrC family response regulator
MPHGLPLGDGETVMVVETDRERLLRSEEMLAALGYEPVGFEHSEDAAAALRSNPSRFDVIVLSYSEDSPDGANLADAFHEMAPSLPLVLAAPPAADLSSRALAESGVSEVLQKPLVSAELGAAMVRSLRVASQM